MEISGNKTVIVISQESELIPWATLLREDGEAFGKIEQ